MAGFKAEAESRVLRVGYPNSFSYDGSMSKVEDISKKTHPGLWQVSDLRGYDVVTPSGNVGVGEFRTSGIIGYTGYIPGKDVEPFVLLNYSSARQVCKEARSYTGTAGLNTTQQFETYWDKPQGKKPLALIAKVTDMKHSASYGDYRRPEFTSSTNLVKDHEIPNPIEQNFASLGKAICGYTGYLPRRLRTTSSIKECQDPFNLVAVSVPGYGGYIPGKLSETIFARTFKQTNCHAMKLRKYLK